MGNPNEIPGNGIDDDGNGRIDDTYGWDFVYNDNTVVSTDEHHHPAPAAMLARSLWIG